MITAPTWVILVPSHPGIWVEHTCGRVHSQPEAQRMVDAFRIPRPFIIAQIREPK